jgi:hypothetical protein
LFLARKKEKKVLYSIELLKRYRRVSAASKKRERGRERERKREG